MVLGSLTALGSGSTCGFRVTALGYGSTGIWEHSKLWDRSQLWGLGTLMVLGLQFWGQGPLMVLGSLTALGSAETLGFGVWGH